MGGRDHTAVLIACAHDFAEATPDLDALLELVAKRIAVGIGDFCGLLVLSNDGQTLLPITFHDTDAGAVEAAKTAIAEPLLLSKHPMMKGVLDSGRALLVPKLDADAIRSQTTEGYFAFVHRVGMHSLMLLPMRARQKPVGLLALLRMRPESPAYDEADQLLAQSLANLAALAISNATAWLTERAAREAAEAAREALRQNEHGARLLFEESPLPSLVFDAETFEVLAANEAAQRLYGYSLDELLALTIPQLRSADEVPLAALLKASHGADTASLARHRRKDGSEVIVEGQTHLMTFDGRRARLAVMADVTDRKRAERTLEHLREAQASERMFRTFVEQAPDAIVVVNTDREIVLVNLECERLFDRDRSQLLGKSVDVLVPERFREGHAEFQRRDGLTSSGDERVGLRADGTEFPIEVSTRPLETPDGTLICNTVRDVSVRKATQAALVAANQELEAFSYSVAHDLRTPLRATNGYAKILLDEYGEKLDENALGLLNQIRKASLRMGELIDALLTLAKVTRTVPVPEQVDLSEVARQVAAALSVAEPERRVEWVISGGLTAKVDAALARTLLDNLMGNAWKFTAKTPHARIEVGLEGSELVVRDNGAGFDMAYVNKLFAPFQRLHTAREFPGTGIGLATVQRIVKRHGGTARAEGKVGGGAAFYFTIG